jgi:catecholate siderophore receptor
MLELQMKHPKGTAVRRTHSPELAPKAPCHLLPLAAMMLAGSMGAAQPALAQSEEKTLKTVTVKDTQDPNLSKESLLVKQTGIAKGNQQLKDIPQTVTVMTEKLMADRNYDDFREVLKATAGVTFQAGETGEEDVRMRGFSLGQAGDIYVDGLRDAPLTERDTFNTDRVEVLKGSASMLFGKGSTGGVVNQVNKQPFLMDQNETNVTIGSGNMKRLTADMNKQTDESSAFRLNAMTHEADNWGAKVDKKGVAGTYRWGIGEKDEFSTGLYHLKTDGRPIYNHPWLINNGSSTSSNSTTHSSGTIVPVLNAKNYYGLSSDYLRTETTYGTLTHKHRFDADSELNTTVRHGHYERNLLGNQISWHAITTLSNLNDSTVLQRRAPKARYGISDVTQMQTDFTNSFTSLGYKHSLIAGADYSEEKALRNNNAIASVVSGLVQTNGRWGYPTNPAPAYVTTTVGTPNDGESVSLLNGAIPGMRFKSQVLGAYAQDTVSLSDTFKVLGGLRVDRFNATFIDTATPPNSASVDKTLFSPRMGAIWQPNDVSSYYTSYGTSFNTSADSYVYAINTGLTGDNAKTMATPPEKSRNFEVGGKFDVFDKKGLLGIALFYSEKYNERNTDTDTASSQMLLSGKRHATGMEFNFAGRLTPAWEMFYNHTWIPEAKIDESNEPATVTRDNVTSNNSNQQKGDRSALTPKHSASLWTTYRITPLWRVGSGLNYRGQQNPEGARTKVAAAFTTVDAMAEYTVNDANVLKLNVSNLTNKLYADSLYRGFYVPGAPRRVELSWKSMF